MDAKKTENRDQGACVHLLHIAYIFLKVVRFVTDIVGRRSHTLEENNETQNISATDCFSGKWMRLK